MWQKVLTVALIGFGLLILTYVLLTFFSPEVGPFHLRGPVTLNNSGAGYVSGDVVWLGAPEALNRDDVVLIESPVPKGFGPIFAVAFYRDLQPVEVEHIVAKIRYRLGHNYLREVLFSKRGY